MVQQHSTCTHRGQSLRGVLLTFVFTLSFLGIYQAVFAAPPSSAYTPGETLNPSCSPGDSYCTVSVSTAAYFTATSTIATSTFAGGISTGLLSISSTTATSTFANGINLTGGCFSVNGTCVGAGSGTVNSGTAGYLAYYPSTGTTVDDAGSLFWDNTNSRLGIGTSTPGQALSVGGDILGNNIIGSYFTSTSTATSTFIGGFQTAALNVTGSATSTFANGVDLAAGCFSINGVCSGVVGSGIANHLTYYASTGTTVDDAGSLFWDNTNSRLGIGTSTPYAALSVVGEAVARNFTATSTTATSTFAGGLNVGNGGLVYDYSSGVTSVSNLELGNINFGADSGIVTWVDMPVSSTVSANTVESYTAAIDGNSLLTLYSVADGSGGVNNLRVGIGTSTPYAKLSVAGNVAAGYYIATTTATSTFAGGLQTALLNVTSSATSTFANGINLTGGCFSVNGTCVGAGSGSGTVNSGTAGYLAYYPSTGTTVDDAGSLFWDNTNSRLGIGTSSPYAALSVVGEAVARNFTATSTTATSTFAGGLNVGSGALTYDYSSGVTSISNLEVGAQTFEADSGMISWLDMPVTSGSSNGTVESYTARIDGNDLLTLYSTADGLGGVTNLNVGIGTSTPYAKLSVAGNIVADGMLRVSYIISTSTATSTFGGGIASSGLLAGSYFYGTSAATSTLTGGLKTTLLNVTGSATSTFANGINLSGGCFSVNGTCITAGGGGSGTVNSGTAGYLAYYPSTGTTVDDAGSLFWDNTNSRLGIGTSTPYAALSVVGEAVARNFTATSTTATSTFAGGLNVGNGGLVYDYSSGVTSVSNLELGGLNFEANSGIVSWVDMPVTASASSGTIESYSASIDGNPILTVYSTSDGSGGTANRAVGIGTTTPVSTLSVQGSLCVRDTGSCGTTAGTIYATTASITDIDLAENYPTSDETLNAGEIVSLVRTSSSTMIERATATTSTSLLLGIISTKPGIVLGKEVQNGKPVALKGRVPVKVNMSAGEILPGDRITISKEAGVGMKAITTGYTVGIALESYTATTTDGTVLVYVENEHYIPESQLTIQANGNVGIGVSDPIYQLQVAGDIGATSFVNISTRSAKKDIMHLSDSDYEEFLNTIKDINLAQYHYNFEEEDSPLRLGLIAEESPKEILNAAGNGVDLYKFATFMLGGIKAQQIKIDDLASRVSSLEAALANRDNSTSGLVGEYITEGIAHFKKLIVDSLEIGSTSNSTRITVYDKNGQAGCLTVGDVNSGSVTVTSGACSDESSSNSDTTATSTANTDGVDTIPPTITLIGSNPINLIRGDRFIDPGATVDDNINKNLGVYVSGDDIDTAVLGEHVITYTAHDQAGNSATTTRSVIVSAPETTNTGNSDSAVIENNANVDATTVVEDNGQSSQEEETTNTSVSSYSNVDESVQTDTNNAMESETPNVTDASNDNATTTSAE